MREIPNAIRQLRAMNYIIRLRSDQWCVFRSNDDLLKDVAIARDADFVNAVSIAVQMPVRNLAPELRQSIA